MNKLPCILLVDPELKTHKYLKLRFATKYEILSATTGDEAFALLRQTKSTKEVKVVIACYRLRTMTGLEFLERVAGVLPKAKRIVTTGYPDRGRILDSPRRKACDTFVTKPFDMEQFGAAIRSAVESYDLRNSYDEVLNVLKANHSPDVVENLRLLASAGPVVQHHSCFISYSTKDEDFARRLHSHMQKAGIQVWFAPEDIKGGEKIHEQVFEAIQRYDKLLLVLSENSLRSEWVATEIRKAREVEKRENRRKLFPIRLVDFDTLRAWSCFDADTGKDLAVELREYFIPDFSNWKDHDAFEAAFARLQKDLKEEPQRKQ